MIFCLIILFLFDIIIKDSGNVSHGAQHVQYQHFNYCFLYNIWVVNSSRSQYWLWKSQRITTQTLIRTQDILVLILSSKSYMGYLLHFRAWRFTQPWIYPVYNTLYQ